MKRPSIVETVIENGDKVYVGGNSHILISGKLNI